MHKKKAFTLVEMLFVVIIAAGVMMFAMPAYRKVQERSRYSVALGLLQDYGTALLSMRQEGLKCPFGGKVVQIKWNTSVCMIPGAAHQTLQEAMEQKEGVAAKNQYCLQLLAALYEMCNKIGPEDTDYNFFLVHQATDVGDFVKTDDPCRLQCVYKHPISSRQLNTSKVLACMCKPLPVDNRPLGKEAKEPGACFLGAKIMLDGTVERIVDTGCTTQLL